MSRPESDAYLMGAVEALLFVSDEPVGAVRLAALLGEQPGRIDAVLQALQDEYAQDNRGMQLREVAGGWRFYSHPAYHELIEGYIRSWDPRRMSQAALEALAVMLVTSCLLPVLVLLLFLWLVKFIWGIDIPAPRQPLPGSRSSHRENGH